MGFFDRLIKKNAPNVEPAKEDGPVFAPLPRDVIDLLPVSSGKKWGFIDLAGQIVIPPQFDGARTFSDGLAPVWDNDKIGFIDKTGKIVVEPQFTAVFGGFREGRAPVRVERLWRIIDTSGAFVGQVAFEEVNPFCEGYARVKQGDRWGYVNLKGEIVIAPDFLAAADFSEGWAGILDGKTWSFIDKSGAVVLKTEFGESLSPHFSEGCALGRINEGYGSRLFFINRKGEIVSSGWRLAGDFSEGLALVATRDVDPLYSYITKDGKYAFRGEFLSATSFSEGLAGVKTQAQKWGFIDTMGRIALEAKFDYVLGIDLKYSQGFYSGIAIVKIGERSAYVDKSGRVISYKVLD